MAFIPMHVNGLQCRFLKRNVAETNQVEKTERDDLEYAGFWIRAWAFVIDGFLIALVTTPLSSTMFGFAYIATTDLLLDFLVSSLLPAALVILFWVYKGATPGKMAISAKVVDAVTGEHPSTPRYIARYVGYLLSFLPLGLGFIWIAFDKRKQGWHDKLSGTVVVRKKPENVVFSRRKRG